MKEEFGDWVANNEGQLMEDFIGDNYEDSELLHGALSLATVGKQVYSEPYHALEAFIMASKLWRERFDAYCERAWEARGMAGEPERD